jgi:hypothetical protein
MAIIFSTSFTVGANTEINGITPDVGASITLIHKDSTAEITAIATTDLARPLASVGDAGVAYTADATYPSANYEAIYTMVGGGTAVRPHYIGVRCQDANNLYCVRASAAASGCRLHKRIAGTWTALGTAVTIANGSIIKVQIIGTTLKLFDDGVEVDSVDVSGGDLISAAGKGLIAMGGGTFGTASTDDTNTGVSLDDWSINDLGAGGAIAVPVFYHHLKQQGIA